MDGSTLERWAYVIIIFTVLLKVAAKMLPQAQDAGDELNATGAPLADFFTSDGVVFLMVVAGLVLLVVKTFIVGRK